MGRIAQGIRLAALVYLASVGAYFMVVGPLFAQSADVVYERRLTVLEKDIDTLKDIMSEVKWWGRAVVSGIGIQFVVGYMERRRRNAGHGGRHGRMDDPDDRGDRHHQRARSDPHPRTAEDGSD